MLLLTFTAPDGRKASITDFGNANPVLVVEDKTVALRTHDGASFTDGNGFFYLPYEGVFGHLSYIADTPVSFTPWARLG